MTEKTTFISNNIIKKAIIPVAGVGTRFLPLTKVGLKEFLPLVDKPLIHYVVAEVCRAGIGQVIFVTNPKRKEVLEYFKKSPELEETLKERKREHLLGELEKINKISENVSFSSVFFSSASQKRPLGDGHAILQAASLASQESCAVLFPDDIIDSKTPCIEQLIKVFKTCRRPVIAIKQIPKEKVSRYGVVMVEKIAHRFYKIKKIVEKPSLKEAPSDLVIVGRYIVTPEVFDELKKTKPNKRGEIILADALSKIVEDGKTVYGYEFEGEWLDCGEKLNWLKSNLYLSLKHPQFGQEIKKYLKEIQ